KLKQLELQRRPIPPRLLATLRRLEQQVAETTGTSLQEWQTEVVEAHRAVRRRRKPLPHRTPSRRADEEAQAGPADVHDAPERHADAANAEYALADAPRPPPATPGRGPGLVAGPGMAVVDMPNPLNVD